MKLTGLHLLLTYTCNYECDHCFVWGSPAQEGTFTAEKLEVVFEQALEVPTLETIFFEGGEPFLFFPTLEYGVTLAHALGFVTGIVSNNYWAADFETAIDMLRPLAAAGLDRISLSSDSFHPGAIHTAEEHPGVLAARQLGLEANVIYIDSPMEHSEAVEQQPGKPVDAGGVMFRGRAARNLTPGLPRTSWQDFDACPHERLDSPERVHLDPYGNLHLCQGILMGNLFERPLKEILSEYVPEAHPIVGPLIKGGPAELASRLRLEPEEAYVDACHLCYDIRDRVRPQLSEFLGPEAMYGVPANKQ